MEIEAQSPGSRAVLHSGRLTPEGLAIHADAFRLDATRKLPRPRRVELGQFLTPEPTARFMASMFGDVGGRSLRVLEAGAGVGSLIAAFVSEMATRTRKPKRLAVTAYEIACREVGL